MRERISRRRNRPHFLSAAAVSVLVLSSVSCGSETAAEAPGSEAPSPVVATEKDFDPALFADPTTIDNRWFPVQPGTQFIYRGFVNDGPERLRHSVVFTVTDLTKVIDGVRTVVIWDRDYTGGELVEGELAFFAQDDAGNVWNMGEYPEEWEDGAFAGAPDTWIAGLAGARPGILMRAEPAVGTSSYLQGFAPEIDFADLAKVYQTGQSTCVPFGCYDGVLVTDEWNPDEPGAHQRKFYAAGVGGVQVGFAGPKEKEMETLELVKVTRLTAEELAEVRADALRLEDRGYEFSKVYGQTPPAE